MEPIVKLKDNYIHVAGNFGGSQTFFRADKGLLNKMRDKGGCGVVAITDTVLYLSGQHEIKTVTEYKKLFKKTSKCALWVPVSFGMTFLQLAFGFKSLSKLCKLAFNSRWCFSLKKLPNRIQMMLSNDIPVILCIPKNLGRRIQKYNLAFYNSDLTIVSGTNGHFVVVTGLYKHPYNDEEYLEISSWGNRYYVNLNEYISFSKKHLMRVAGNMLYIKRDAK